MGVPFLSLEEEEEKQRQEEEAARQAALNPIKRGLDPMAVDSFADFMPEGLL